MAANRKQIIRSLLVGGLLPVIAYSVIEDRFGIVWGLIAGMVFGVGEILYEWFKLGRVDPVTWGGNGLILILGGVSLLTNSGIWFKLQPALMEAAMALILWGSLLAKKQLLLAVAKRQAGESWKHSPHVEEILGRAFRGMTFRMGIFLAAHAVLATWAAIHWSTAAWALLKGVGFTGSMFLYMLVETLQMRYRLSSTR